MQKQIRILDVGLDSNGASTVLGVDVVPTLEGVDIELWQSFATSVSSARRDVPFYPPPGAGLLRYFVLPAPLSEPEPVEWQAIADGFFSSNDIDDCRVEGARHPLMHRTPTSDCVILLEGRVELLLDKGEPIKIEPLEVVRQRATSHAWVNLGPGPALLISLMYGT